MIFNNKQFKEALATDWFFQFSLIFIPKNSSQLSAVIAEIVSAESKCYARLTPHFFFIIWYALIGLAYLETFYVR